jgi:hypothetical protein
MALWNYIILPATPAGQEANMSSETIELLKILASFGGAILGGIGALTIKEWSDRRRSKQKEYQTRWLPLYSAAKDLRSRFGELIATYKQDQKQYQWSGHKWTDSERREYSLGLEARDFHELYLLNKDLQPIYSFNHLPNDPGDRRKDDYFVQKVRGRIHELNLATTSLYRTARYLGYAQRVHRELQLGQLEVPDASPGEMMNLLSKVRRELNGKSGSGMVDDLQDLIGEAVWSQDNSVITYYEFRERLLSPTGWEQYIELFRFFVHFHLKVDHEVKNTIDALTPLCSALEQIVGSRKPIRSRFLFLTRRQDAPGFWAGFRDRLAGFHRQGTRKLAIDH